VRVRVEGPRSRRELEVAAASPEACEAWILR
jgi:hypothetical protein